MREGPPKIQPVAPEVPEELVPTAPSEGLDSPSAPEVEAPEVPQELIPVEVDEVSLESAEEFPDLPKEGDPVTLTKTALDEGAESAFPVGTVFKGVLLANIEINKQIFVGGNRTSRVSEIQRVGEGTFRIRSGTSWYELVSGYSAEGADSTANEPLEAEGTEEATVEAAPEPLKEGERVSIQKVSMLDFKEAQGERMEMALVADLMEGSVIAAASEDDLFNSSIVKKIESEGGTFYATTASGSVYAIRRAE